MIRSPSPCFRTLAALVVLATPVLAAGPPVDAVVVFNEIMYHPAADPEAGEWNNTGVNPGAGWTDPAYDDSQAGWQTGQALFDFGNTTIYDDYPGGPPVVGGNAEVTGVTNLQIGTHLFSHHSNRRD